MSRYLLTQSSVNSGYGLLFGLGLYWIGVPYSPFWGGIAAVLRFIPHVGVLIAGACPVLLSLAVFDDWKRPLFTLGQFVVIEAVISGIIEPWILATRTGISSLAILVSATFWTVRQSGLLNAAAFMGMYQDKSDRRASEGLDNWLSTTIVEMRPTHRHEAADIRKGMQTRIPLN